MEEIKLSENINNSGLTYSQSTYNEYYKTRDKNLFEKVIDSLMLNKYSGDQELIDYIKNLPNDKKRIAILSLLDGDNNLWSKINDHIKIGSKMDYIKDVVLMLREFVKVGEVEKKKYGEVMTPLDLVKDMLNTLPKDVWSNPNLKWLDPANGTGPFPIMVIYKLMNGLKDWEPDEEKRYKHIIENMIYTCELQDKNVFLWLCAVDPKDEYTTNTYWGSFLEEGFDKHMKEVWGLDKFDIVIGNPPFMKKLHIEFMEKSHNISKKVIFVHPSTWLFRKESISNKKKNRIKSIRLINGNYHFKNAEFGSPLSITYITEEESNYIDLSFDTTNNKYIVEELPCGFYEPSEIMLSLYKKFSELSYNNNLSNILVKNDGEGVFITTPRICGHSVNRKDKTKFTTDDFYILFYKKSDLSNINTDNKVFKVNTIEERDRLISFMKTKICRFGLYLNKISQDSHINKYLSMIPLPPLNMDISEFELCNHFNITDNEWEFIESVIPDYY